MIVQFYEVSRSVLHSRNNPGVRCAQTQPAAGRGLGARSGASVSGTWPRSASNAVVPRCGFLTFTKVSKSLD